MHTQINMDCLSVLIPPATAGLHPWLNNVHQYPTVAKFHFLLIITLAGGLLRFAGLDQCPPGLFRDEAEKGYNAWALTTTGGALDFTGGTGPGPAIQWRPWPWMINVMGGKTSAIYQYSAIPFVWAGGLTVSTTRMASAFIGTLTIFLLGWLLMHVWGGWPGLAAAAWLASTPWHLVFSRWALEGIFVPLLMTMTLAGLWGLENRRRWGFPLAGAALGWLFYSYSGAQPLVFAWGICLMILYWQKINWKDWPTWLAVLLFLLPFAPTVAVRLSAGGSTRLTRIAIWNEPGATTARVIYLFCRNYLAHLNPIFLFVTGDSLPRHGVPNLGQLPLVSIFLFPVGLWASLRKKLPLAGGLLAAFLCGPIPAALTNEGIPHALRSIGMLVPMAAWSGLGLAEIALWIDRVLLEKGEIRSRRLIFSGLFVVACFAVAVFGVVVYWRACTKPMMQVAFEAGERQTWEAIAKEKQPDQRVYVNGYIPYIPYYELFFLRLPARRIPFQGLEQGGFIYFDPNKTSKGEIGGAMLPGDWLIDAYDPSKVTIGLTEAPLLTEADKRRVREIWVKFTRK